MLLPNMDELAAKYNVAEKGRRIVIARVEGTQFELKALKSFMLNFK